MLFVGEKETGYFINRIANELDLEYKNIPPAGSIKEQINSILAAGAEDYSIFDISQYMDSEDEIVDGILTLSKINQSKVIIFAVQDNISTSLIEKFYNNNIKRFITSKTTESMSDQLYKCINGYFDQMGNPDIVQLANKKAAFVNEKKGKTIGVLGSCSRIGTTTFAIQIVKHLQTYGYKCCYVQANNTEYINSIIQYFSDVTYDNNHEKITYSDIEHYFYSAQSDDLAFSYDYIVYDFGSIESPSYSRELFLKMDEKIAVSGTDPNEFTLTIKLLKNPFYNDIKYVFNFISNNEVANIIKLMQMENKDDKTFVCTYHIPDKYSYTEMEFYDKLINARNLNPVEEENVKILDKLSSSLAKTRKKLLLGAEA